MNVHYKKQKENIAYKKNHYEELENRIKNKNEGIVNAFLKLKRPLKGYNYIVYKFDNPKREIVLNVNDTMKKKVFKLHENEDGVLSIINTN